MIPLFRDHRAMPRRTFAALLAAMLAGVAALPAVAGMKGWSWLYGLGTAGCVILTVMAAFLAYTARQGEVAAARQTSADGYESARRDEADARRDEGEARADAAAILESASVDELVLLMEAAKAKAGREEGRGGLPGQVRSRQGCLCSARREARAGEGESGGAGAGERRIRAPADVGDMDRGANQLESGRGGAIN